MKKEECKKIQIKYFFKYLIIFILFIILTQTDIVGNGAFCVALLFALMWTSFNPYIISCEFLLCELLKEFSLQNIYINICVVFVMIITYMLHKKIKKPMNLYLVAFYMCLSTICYCYYAFAQGKYLTMSVYYILLLVSFVMYALVFQVAILRGLYYKLALNEAIAFVYLLITLGVGLNAIHFYNFSFVKFVCVIIVLFLNLIKKEKISYVAGLSLVVGAFVGGANDGMIANISIILLAVGLFRTPHKYYMALSLLIVDFCVQILSGSSLIIATTSLTPTILAIVVVLSVPKKYIEKIIDRFYITENEMSMRNIVNLTRSNLHRRFYELANVFHDMKAIHLGLMRENINKSHIVKMLSTELKSMMCQDCKNYNICYRHFENNEFSTIEKLVSIAIEKDRLTLLDIPANLSVRCGMINLLIGRINQLIVEYKQFLSVKRDINNVKFLLAEQIGAVGQIMQDLGNEVDKHICFDSHKESQIVEDLLRENIICSEVLLYNEGDNDFNVDLIVKGENSFNPKIEEIISKRLKKKMTIVSSKPIEVSGFYCVSLEVENNYDVVFGLANCTKAGSNASGDSHSLLRLGKNKYLIALCDGMGSGETAQKTSSLTVGLIENFYKAGFDNDIIISSINKLLSLNNQENFSTLDLCLLDLNNQMVDFIKIGAVFSIVKRENMVEKIEGGALPIGVLDSVSPYSYQTTIDTKSYIIMMTDGVSDAFNDFNEFDDFVKGLATNNPQTVAQTILDEAVRRNDNVIKDDMTVLVVRTFRKNI